MSDQDKRLAEVAARLLTGKLPKHFKFNMSRFLVHEGCDTCGCIAGLAVALHSTPPFSGSIKLRAAWLLGLDLYEAGDLFTPSQTNMSYENVTEKQAGRVLTRFVRTGRIDWSKRNESVKVAGRAF